MASFNFTHSGAYLQEVQYQTDAFLSAMGELEPYSGRELSDDEWLDYEKLAFRNIQLMIMSAGQLSKLFWVPDLPKGKQHSAREKEVQRYGAARAAYLRKVCEVANDSAIRSRHVRNAYEHLDHRLDRLFSKGVGLSLRVNRATGNNDAWQTEGKRLMQRHFNPDTNVLTVMNEEVVIPPLVQEVIRVARVVDGVIQSHPQGPPHF